MNKPLTILLGLVHEGDLPLIQGACLGVDYGVEFAYHHHLSLIGAIGDFDSVSPSRLPNLKEAYGQRWIHLPTHKDITDADYAIEWAIEQGYQPIHILGGIGGRTDHFYALLNTLTRHAGYPLTLVNAQQSISALIPGTYAVEATHQYVSIFARDEVTLSIKDAMFPIHKKKLSPLDTLGVSNTWMNGQPIQLMIERGVVLVFLTSDSSSQNKTTSTTMLSVK
jgi:thiamine pyrophosphokinase